MIALQPEPLSAYTTTYDERGWFTGVRSEVTIPKSQAVVYASLSKDLHKVFTPMTVRAGCPQQASWPYRQHNAELHRVQHPASSDQQLQALSHRVLFWCPHDVPADCDCWLSARRGSRFCSPPTAHVRASPSSPCKHIGALLSGDSVSVCLLHTPGRVASLLQVCDDTVEEDDGEGAQTLFRVVRIPFRVLFVTGNLKMRLHVEQDSKTGHVSALLTCRQLLLPWSALLLHQPWLLG